MKYAILMGLFLASCALTESTVKQGLCTIEDQENGQCPPSNLNQAPYDYAAVSYNDTYIPGSFTSGTDDGVEWAKLWVFLPQKSCLITCTVPESNPDADPDCTTQCYQNQL